MPVLHPLPSAQSLCDDNLPIMIRLQLRGSSVCLSRKHWFDTKAPLVGPNYFPLVSKGVALPS